MDVNEQLSRCSGGILVDVTVKILAPPISPGWVVTWRRWRIAGRLCIVLAACALAVALHSSPVFHRTFQLGLRGAAMIRCISGLTSRGTGKVFAGNGSGGRLSRMDWESAFVHKMRVALAQASRSKLLAFIGRCDRGQNHSRSGSA